jgi:HSP20 family molecular chaperone IbpA
VTARVAENALLIDSAAPHAYRKRVALPAAVDAARMTVSCRNGILEVRLPRAEGAP